MSELRDFAVRLIESSGGLAEVEAQRVTAVLGEGLAGELGLPEDVVLTPVARQGCVTLAYGSVLLARMLAVVNSAPAWATARLAVEAPAPRLVEQAAARFVLRNGVSTVGTARETVGRHILAHVAVTLRSDDEHRELLSAALSSRTLTPVDGFEQHCSLPLLEERAGPDPSKVISAELSEALARACWRAAQEPIHRFRARMQRRFGRQWQRVHRAYFREAMAGAGETEDPALIQSRDLRLEELGARFGVQAELRPVALIQVETPVLLCDVELRRRKASRRLELEYDAATRAFVPPRCDGCGGPAPQPAACDDELHLLCESCLPSASGRPRCPVCK